MGSLPRTPRQATGTAGHCSPHPTSNQPPAASYSTGMRLLVHTKWSVQVVPMSNITSSSHYAGTFRLPVHAADDTSAIKSTSGCKIKTSEDEHFLPRDRKGHLRGYTCTCHGADLNGRLILFWMLLFKLHLILFLHGEYLI